MPLDSTFNYYRNRIQWEERFCLLPHSCNLTNKILWLTTAMYGVKIITGPGEPLRITYWQGLEEHLMWKLKQ